MTADEIHKALLEKHEDAILGFHGEASQPYVEVDPMRIHELADTLKNELGFDRLHTTTGVDYEGIDEKGRGKHREINQYEEDGTVRLVEGEATGELGVVYHLESLTSGDRIVLKVRLDRNEPEVESVSGVWRTALWCERETYDFYGIEFLNHPDLRRILLPEDWVGWPLRKDYQMPRAYHDVPLEGLPLAVREQQATEDPS